MKHVLTVYMVKENDGRLTLPATVLRVVGDKLYATHAEDESHTSVIELSDVDVVMPEAVNE